MQDAQEDERDGSANHAKTSHKENQVRNYDEESYEASHSSAWHDVKISEE